MSIRDFERKLDYAVASIKRRARTEYALEEVRLYAEKLKRGADAEMRKIGADIIDIIENETRI